MNMIDRTRRQPATSSGLRAAMAAAVVALAIAALVGLALLTPGQALAKGGELQAWLDHPLPEDAAPGTDLTIGFLLWDPLGHGLAGTFPTLEIRPADGSGAPVTVSASQDWPGHFVAEAEVPAGGLSEIVITFPGSACDADGCRDADVKVPIAGVGLPPGIPVQAIADARITRPDAIAAGEPAPLAVTLTPNPGPDPKAFPAPRALYLTVVDDAGATVETVALAPSEADPLRYIGEAALGTAGDYRLRVGTSDEGSPDNQFSTIVTRLVVTDAVAPASIAAAPVNSSPSAAGSQPFAIEPFVALGVIGFGVVVLVAGGVVAGRRPQVTSER